MRLAFPAERRKDPQGIHVFGGSADKAYMLALAGIAIIFIAVLGGMSSNREIRICCFSRRRS